MRTHPGFSALYAVVRTGWARAAMLFFLAAVLLHSCGPDEAQSGRGDTPPPRPNLLILITDDQRWDQLSSADQPVIPQLQTPHIDALADEGVYFRNAFVTTPVCCVSRANIVTGQYVSSHGMNHFRTDIAPEVLNTSYPALLRKRGYRTGVLGKWGMGMGGTEAVFDVIQAWTGQGGYFHETKDGRIHNAEWLARRAREFFQSQPPDQPFCLTVNYKSPHHPWIPDPRDQDLFAGVDIPRQPTDTVEAYAAKPAHIMENSLNRWCYFDERGSPAVRENYEKNVLRCIASVDRSVGKIMEALREHRFDENTVVVFLSDHGSLWGEHGLGGKWLLYEESIRIPMIIRVPGLANNRKGARLDPIALSIDVAPTLLDFAGLPIPTEMDGLSLKPLIEEGQPPGRDAFFMEHVGVTTAPKTPIPDSQGVRTAEWKYIRYLHADPVVEELFHLSADPRETRNLIGDESARDARAQMRARYERFFREQTE